MVARTTGLRIVARPGHPDFLDLPWDLPLVRWRVDRVVEVTRGVSRHVVRFVDYDGALYAVKELPARVANREYRMLRRLDAEALPVVEAVGVVEREGLEAALITRYLDYSLPYRALFTHRRSGAGGRDGLEYRLLDALAILLVRLHMAGFYWGDCSLNNTLFRRDAGALAAYLVDAETSEWHPELTPGQREEDLDLTVINVAGGLTDVQAQLGLDPDPDPFDTAHDLRRRYEGLWAELTSEEAVVGSDGQVDRHAIERRMRRLNELGFDVDEIELAPSGDRLVLRANVVESGHHRRRLHSLTGLDAQENQARSLLNDLANHRAAQERRTGRPLPETVGAHRWLAEVFERITAAIPAHLHAKLEPVEVVHEIIEHKWFLSEAAGRDVGLDATIESYMRSVLPTVPDELLILDDDESWAEGWIGYG